MAARDNPIFDITPDVVLHAYTRGIFPMAESADDPDLLWIEPQHRGVLPLENAHFPRRLLRTVKTTPLIIRIDTDYDGIIDGCAAERPGRATTWINQRIRDLYRELFAQGHCHTVEVWRDDVLVGGLYGVSLKAAFFGESMFSFERDVSKIALAHLVARLIAGNYMLLDTQFVTEHLRQFGTEELNRKTFQKRLEAALQCDADFFTLPRDVGGPEVVALLGDPGG